MSKTVELSRGQPDRSTHSKGSSPRRRLWWLTGGFVLVAATIAVIAMATLGGAKRGPRAYTRIIGTTPLFDGVTLAGWDVGGGMVGAWNTVEAPDSSTAIACTTGRGALTRRLPQISRARIGLFVWLQPGGGPIDIDFAFQTANPNSARGCIRLTDTVNRLGVKTSDFGDLDVVAESEALATVHDRYHVIHLERQPTDWFVFLEERLLGTVPITDVGDGNAIRIVVHASDDMASTGPRAYFSDFQLYDLSSE